MEIFEHDRKNIDELLETIAEVAGYYAKELQDNDDKTFQQPMFFNKPKNVVKWENAELPKISYFNLLDLFSLEHDRGMFDADVIWYNEYVLNKGGSLILHDPLDWQLIAVSSGEIMPENKIYVNTNKDSELFGFYVYAPGSDDEEVFNYWVLATTDEQFSRVWVAMKKVFEIYKQNGVEPDHGGRDVPLKIVSKLVTKKGCLLDDYYTCSEKDCVEKKREICRAVGAAHGVEVGDVENVQVIVRGCGSCYWVRLESEGVVLVGGDLFYDRLRGEFASRGKMGGFPKWEDSFERITKALKIEI